MFAASSEIGGYTPIWAHSVSLAEAPFSSAIIYNANEPNHRRLAAFGVRPSCSLQFVLIIHLPLVPERLPKPPIFAAPASPPRSGPAAPLRRFKDVDPLETKSLAAVSSMELGSLVSIKAVVLCTLPIANITSASFSGPILKIVLGDIEGLQTILLACILTWRIIYFIVFLDPSSQVLGVCFGPRAVLLPRLLKMNEV